MHFRRLLYHLSLLGCLINAWRSLTPCVQSTWWSRTLRNKSLTQPFNLVPPLPQASLGAQVVKNLLAMQETLVWSLGREDPLQKRMATHSSVLAWKIPWTEELGGYSPWGRRVRGNCATHTFTLLHQWKPPPSSQRYFLQSSLNGLFKMQMRSWQSLVPGVSRHPHSETLTPYFLALSVSILLCPQGSSSLNECNCGQKTPV